jgi:hypothetical protein
MSMAQILPLSATTSKARKALRTQIRHAKEKPAVYKTGSKAKGHSIVVKVGDAYRTLATGLTDPDEWCSRKLDCTAKRLIVSNAKTA